MTAQTTHSRPPLLAPEIFMAVARNAEKNVAAKMVVIFDSETLTTVTGMANAGSIAAWNVLTPTSLEGTQAFLADEIKRGNVSEPEVIFLRLDEVGAGDVLGNSSIN